MRLIFGEKVYPHFRRADGPVRVKRAVVLEWSLIMSGKGLCRCLSSQRGGQSLSARPVLALAIFSFHLDEKFLYIFIK